GVHWGLNSLCVLLMLEALGEDLQTGLEALAGFTPLEGRGLEREIALRGGAFTLIDESYNANPISMRAALSLLGATQPGPGGRRIAVIGDMLELGAQGGELHATLAPDLAANYVDLLFGAGPLTRALYDAVPAAMRGAHAPNAEGLRAPLFAALRAGDVVMIKASNGSRMGPLAAALREHFQPAAAGDRR
ncbi:MAG: UDP-N-acetylmuramoylalanyl-D-glutamyl-2, 6-diaminopimelate--D-alanyl-D-alanine ligase, partial [Pseudomonadota bacterium]|nr:UDP-N-acetylmuramoylalanyl-D-glutamyl-2, 6-diaminopimelate--D-alanyl-D-alanine ligase [Pseudomonadota bacterium]